MLYNRICYDPANRASWVVGAGQYKHTASNERLLVRRNDSTNEVHMRGPGGELVGVCRIDWENGNGLYTLRVRLEQHERVHVAGRLLFLCGTIVATDRIGSVVYK